MWGLLIMQGASFLSVGVPQGGGIGFDGCVRNNYWIEGVAGKISTSGDR